MKSREYKQGYRDGWNAALDEAEAILMDIMARNEKELREWGGNGMTGKEMIGAASSWTRTEDGGSSLTSG